MPFTYATARSLVSASIAASGLNLSMPVIAYNGAFIFEPSGKILSSNVFSEEERQNVVDFLNTSGVYPLVYAFIDGKEKVSWMQGKENNGMLRYLSLRQGDRRLTPLTDINHLYRGNVFYVTCIGEKEELWPIYDRFKDDPHYNCILQQELYREEYWCEIMPKAASKANAILRLKELGNYTKIVSFGDALNDIPMFSISDECYAVENAVKELKEMATDVIESNVNDGVAKWLLKHTEGINEQEKKSGYYSK
jgi:HAD superfamily hydrolase (TIGR01484 family)